ncbi:hypothetical protein AMJ83_01945 [candidate division WOR_3 bacterium SM23_42]|uniref:DUF4386 domain-containing protein n=1 Tax=candidate division WOR_3 bacterium SM23_42 TaxID=1703779 RepID=A0A0S8FUY0_UNCW3|nr:MAG: hypothetical protein AMJ83_01945 [candidate division WOR_3 bacterium SM23_42]
MVWLAITLGVASIIGGVTHFLMPRAQLHMASGLKRDFFESLGQSAGAFTVHYWAMMIASLAGAAVIMGAGVALGVVEGILHSILRFGAALGFVVAALSFGLMLKQALRLSDAWPNLSESAREAVKTNGLPNIDPWGLFSFFLVGLWFLVFNVTAVNVGALPLWLGIIGCVGGVSFLLVFVGMLLHIGLLVDISAALGCIVVSPMWSFGLAYFLMRVT